MGKDQKSLESRAAGSNPVTLIQERFGTFPPTNQTQSTAGCLLAQNPQGFPGDASGVLSPADGAGVAQATSPHAVGLICADLLESQARALLAMVRMLRSGAVGGANAG